MALKPIDEVHALQIQAGTLGRQTGHKFEDRITEDVNNLRCPRAIPVSDKNKHIFQGEIAEHLVDYVCTREGIKRATKVEALSTGALATSEEGRRWLTVNGADLQRCKSDVILTVRSEDDEPVTVGVSVKQCNNRSPTNAQLYFTTASGFATLLRRNKIAISDKAELALRQFCGETGFRPLDTPDLLAARNTDPRRFFWEEVDREGREEIEDLFQRRHGDIFRLLLQKAYHDDPFVPGYIVHKTRKVVDSNSLEAAIYSVDELIALSKQYKGFEVKAYSVRKGSYKDPAGVSHKAPRFGVVQMQRGGQKQHPTQLQFNLEAGYFYNLPEQFDEVPADGGSE
jgi:hypothetical protein